ncbi:MAG: stage 0 sporulation family protein, partial [Oscillospiraceae bacterium]
MTEIIGVRFKSAGKVYYFSPAGIKAEEGSLVIVETARGVECGEVVMPNREVDDSKITAPLKAIIRLANQQDMKILEQNKAKEQNAFKICQEKIAAHKLDMKLVDVECTFDNNKLLFYFTAETRVDFRELVKDLASVFRTRIELRQIGVRDEAKILGGLGICGREFCCKGFLGEFQPVSIKMAKEQGLSLNPTKISGTCGRLMCCLKYEQDAYEYLLKNTPK